MAAAVTGDAGMALAKTKAEPVAPDDLAQHDAVGLAQLVARGEVSPSELLEAAIARCEAVNPTINAVVMKHYDLARQAIRRGLPEGPLRGVPFLLKDLGIALAGTVTDGGSRLLKDEDVASRFDSTLTRRYKQAGLVIFGKTHSPEFGNSPSSESALYGHTHNPYNLGHSAGGSSGGTAAAVAAGIVPAAHGSDGGGSLRIPASACGLFGLKPTRGRVPLGPPDYEERSGFAVAHAITRTVRDSAALLDIAQGPDVGDPYGAPRYERPFLEEIEREPGRLRIALMLKPAEPAEVDPDCVRAAQQAARACESLGHHVEEASPDIDLKAFAQAQTISGAAKVAEVVKAAEAHLGRKYRPDELEKINQEMVGMGLQASALDLLEARHNMHSLGVSLARFQQDYDVILSPTMAIAPPKLGVLDLNGDWQTFARVATGMSAFTAIFNATGQPAMSVPLSYKTAQGLPIGVMFAARFGDEATLFRLAAQLEKSHPWHQRPVSVS